MKLEFDSNTSTLPLVESDFSVENGFSEAAEMLNAGIKAAQEGRRAEARSFLLRATELDSENENAWLWLASISEYPEELLVFLNSVLKINPGNERALEWAQQTKALLSKTFVQRGVDASKDAQKDFAKQCFLQAIVHDNQNEMAWLWLASVSDSDEEKTAHLQKVLSINPENSTAQYSLTSIKQQMAESIMQKAFEAASAGENAQALDALQEVFKRAPEMESAWILKSFLVESCAEKLECLERILEINPENNLAAVNLSFLRGVAAKAESQEAEEQMREAAPESKEEFFEELSEDKYPTQELEFPEYTEENEAPQAEFEEAEEESYKTESAEDFNSQVEVSEEYQEEEVPYENLDEAENKAELVEENQAESLDESPYEAENEDFRETEEVANVYAYEEREVSAQPYFEESEEEELLEAEEPESHFEAEDDSENAQDAENSFAEENAPEDVYEVNADELYSAEETSEDEYIETAEDSLAEEEFSYAEEEVFAAGQQSEYPEEDFQPQNDFQPQMEMTACPFCSAAHEPQAFVCPSCRAVLTLSDLEMLLAYQEADKEMVNDAMLRMEAGKASRDLETDELRFLAIGYLNLKNLQKGLAYLTEAARMNPDDIVLSSQLNALKIRMAEIEKQESVHNSMPKNRMILVVDDSATVRKLISGKLEKCGHEVVCAIDGVDALDKLKEMTPDLILLDITMPRMDGYQVCKMIRSKESMKDIPIVMISGKDGFFDKVRGRMAGTTGYITKPFGPETLMKTVETYILQPV